MIFIKNKFRIKRFAKNKAYLTTKFGEAVIDKKGLNGYNQGDFVEACLYYDINDILRANTSIYKDIDKIFSLKANEITKNGVFFITEDKKKLFLPFTERTYRINNEMTYPLALKVDQDGMLYLTSKIRNLLSTNHNFKENDQVEGRIYSINKSIGIFLAIDNKFDSLIRNDELRGIYIEGELVNCRVKEVKNDGKIELSLRQRSHLEIDKDSKVIIDKLIKNDGVIEIGDKSSPKIIEKVFGMSKSSYKRALGRLYKNNKIRIFENKIQLLENVTRRKNGRK